jgi:hypothetical protein
MLKDEMYKRFTLHELEVLKNLNYEHHVNQNVWSIKSGEKFVAETQLGYSKGKTQKMLMKALGIFEKYPENEVLKWLGYD